MPKGSSIYIGKREEIPPLRQGGGSMWIEPPTELAFYNPIEECAEPTITNKPRNVFGYMGHFLRRTLGRYLTR